MSSSFASRPYNQLVIDLGAQWRNETGIPVRVFAAPTSSVKGMRRQQAPGRKT
jgi:hypothetical protein